MSTIAVKKYKGIQVEHVKSTLPAEKAELQLRDRILQKLLDANVIEGLKIWLTKKSA